MENVLPLGQFERSRGEGVQGSSGALFLPFSLSPLLPCLPASLHRPAAQGDRGPRIDADEGVAADLLAALDRFQQERRARLVHQLQVDRDRRLQVGGELARHRDQISRPARQFAEFVQRR